MFVDEAKVLIKAGNGGDGAVAFLHEKYVKNGGPSGGNGGNGGDIIFVGESGLTTLIDFKYRRIISSPKGENGRSKNCYGAYGENVYVKVPLGTIVYNETTKQMIANIIYDKQEVIIAKGGKGGRGNATYATARNNAPHQAEKGYSGEEFNALIELKLLADIGIIGLPSVGKSTIISVISKAKPKISDYPFTTLVPNLGVCMSEDGHSFVVADMPGLIEGAHQGIGLGVQFLKHIQRTKILIHVIDCMSENPYNDYIVIRNEIGLFDESLLRRTQLVVVNKIDVIDKENLNKIEKEFKRNKVKIDLFISAATKKNINKLIELMSYQLKEHKNDDFYNIDEVVKEYVYVPLEDEIIITKGDDGIFEVTGRLVKKFFLETDFTKEEQIRVFARRIRRIGVEELLLKNGAKYGDVVRIFGNDFDFTQ